MSDLRGSSTVSERKSVDRDRPLRWLPARSARPVNLSFHGIGDPLRALDEDEDAYWVTRDLFEEVLDWAATQPKVQISFDDGNASDVSIALPALQSRSLKATFFPIGGRLGEVGSVDEAGLGELVAAGMTIGSHGMNHLKWQGLDDQALEVELVDARALIEGALGAQVHVAACPLGSYDRRILRRLRHLGYTQVFTSDRAYARPDAWLQPRFSVRSTDTIADVKALTTSRRRALTGSLDSLRIAVKRFR
jgi:peptidoglycan/xylan/chitin deacetylase (PgdA/CDA1 family)